MRGRPAPLGTESHFVMFRNLLRTLSAQAQTLQDRWYARPFARAFADSRLWSLQRRSITGAFGAGLAICFIPLPIHIPVALLVAIAARVNVPTIIATVFLINPLTVMPVYYVAYIVGRWLLGQEPGAFDFEFSWYWLQHGLGPMWKPFLLGCLACALTLSVSGRLLLDRLWMWRTQQKYRKRGPRSKD